MEEKELKRKFKEYASKNYKRFYPVEFLNEIGFKRYKCRKCGTYFWSFYKREVCGDANCIGRYEFIDNPVTNVRMEYIEVWEKFSEIFKRLGYTPINRYPVVARWRDDVFFVQASIYDFQPHCVRGEVEPPANPLVVPQFCLRFNDIENVGITGRHYTGFVMIGQHAFEKEKYDINEYLRHIYIWLTEGMRIPKEEIVFHEDVWIGGGNLGPSMEFFVRGLEIGNQVYMQYEIVNSDIRDLRIKVLDMGMGQERPAWLLNPDKTSYDVVFGNVIDYILRETGYKRNEDLLKKFLPYASMLDIETILDYDSAFENVSRIIGIGKETLRNELEPLFAIYSIADHTRSLLFAINDGALPSNTGPGYYLRVILRRSLDLMKRFGFEFDFNKLFELHARYLKKQYPELEENLEEIFEIVNHEVKKYEETRRNVLKILKKFKKKKIDTDTMVLLYESYGISPEMIREHLKVEIPKDFYSRLTSKKEEKKVERRKILTENVKETEILYYDDYKLLEFEAKVLKIIDNKYVILDKTAFYPTGGGQKHDTGYINESRVINVFKEDNVIIHEVDRVTFKEGDIVKCKIDSDRRIQLSIHHTATHILNGACRIVLGNHVWQAGAEKDVDKARLDITHYEIPKKEQIEEIEKIANDIIKKNIKVESIILRRDIAERKYGFRIYQGGFVPGKYLRIVKIGDFDIEACGGTHLKYTGEAGIIKILDVKKISDSVIRFEFVAGERAIQILNNRSKILEEISKDLNVKPEQALDAFKKFYEEYNKIKKDRERLIDEIIKLKVELLKEKFFEINDAKVLVEEIDSNMEEMTKIASRLLKEDKNRVIVLINSKKPHDIVIMGYKIDAGKFLKEITNKLGGKGGGRKDIARGFIENKDISLIKNMLKNILKS